MEQYLTRTSDLPTWPQRAALRLLHLIGWRLYYTPLPGPHGIAVVYPHTSNVDFPMGLLAKWALGLKFRWLAKDSLFRGPAGALMRYWGGVAVDRSAPQGAILRLARTMHAHDWFWLVITPEGTRGYRPYWKSGFYRIAMEAEVPVLLVAIDYGKKCIDVTRSMRLSGDEAADMARIAERYAGVQGRIRKDASPIRLADKPARGATEPGPDSTRTET